MKMGLYPKLAWDGIRKNGRLYLPYILTCTGMVMMAYIIDYLHYYRLSQGSDVISEILVRGNFVIAFFSCLFLFYTNSFLIKRRKKEFGLYNILGMGKRNLAIIIVWETLITAAVSVVSGLMLGILFSKLAELTLVNIIGLGANYGFFISLPAIKDVSILFAVIFSLLLINSVRQVGFSTAISLLKSENTGEKPSKTNWLLGIAGLVLLTEAYYSAVTITNPIAAMFTFFIAVIMVIAGTYFVMIAGSVMMCRILQKIKGYYYRPNHFVSVSSMAFRMKRNGAGLASICIIATMVLVMISSTSTLYFGEEDAIKMRYSREINTEILFQSADGLNDQNLENITEIIDSVGEEYGTDRQNLLKYRLAAVAGILNNGTVETDVRYATLLDAAEISKGLYQFYFIPLEDYNRISNGDYSLNGGEALIYVYREKYDRDTISFNNGSSFKIVGNLDSFELDGDATSSMFPTIIIVVPDLNGAIAELSKLSDFNGDPMISPKLIFNFDTELEPQKQIELTQSLWDRLLELNLDLNGCHIRSMSVASREGSRREFLELYGGLFFLGIILSIVFVFAAVLIIYYKQISEGYEDQSRFELMLKIGMTSRGIRKSINSQLLTVFFLPLIFAALHLAFAFPMIKRVLSLFNLSNTSYYGKVTLICFGIFAALYTLVYKITSGIYYRIVRGEKEEAR